MRKWITALVGVSVLLAGGILTPPATQQLVEHNDVRPAPADIPPVRTIADPYPEFNGIAVDSENGFVGMTDPNRKSLLLYDRAQTTPGTAASVPVRQVTGPETYLGMISGIFLDTSRHEIYAVNNDIEDTIVVMSYDSTGNAEPERVISVPHQSWGLAFGRAKQQIAVSVETSNAIVFYSRDAKGVASPLRIIRGPDTGLADPHGISWDEDHGEIMVANHGNFRGLVKNTGDGCVPADGDDEDAEGGQFQEPSIAIYSSDASGNAKPLRTIQGSQTKLDWPMGLGYDSGHNAVAVANNGDNSILIFGRNAGGDARPARVIRGERTGINRPIGLAVDAKNGEIWVANWGDHSALVFDSGANGNVSPKRVIRSAPTGAPTPGFGNPEGLAYDSKREQILVPNCVTEPRVAAFCRSASGNVGPVRVISGQRSKLGRTIHGLVYDAQHDEIIVPNALADAILVFRGDANGDAAPIRIIQGPRTGLVTPHSVSLDSAHDELWVASLTGKRISVFRRDANGNVPPLRMITGPKTQLGHTVGIAVDPKRNLLAVANSKDIVIFNRTDDGDVAPRARIAGPESGISDEPWEMQFYKGKIVLAASNHLHQNLYEEGVKLKPDAKRVPYDPWLNPNLGFVGVWDITANGDVSPELKIGGPFSGLTHPTGLVLNPKDREIYVSDSAKNDVLMFYLPQFFDRMEGKAAAPSK